MLRNIKLVFGSFRRFSTAIDPYTVKLENAKFDCFEQLAKVDSSSVLLSKFYPKYLQNTYVAIKSINIELSKISFAHQPGATDKSRQFNNLKFAFWEQQIDKCSDINLDNAAHKLLDINEPAMILLADSLIKNLKFDINMVKQMVHSHKHFYNNISNSGFRDIEEICSFGEGTYSQINYIMQSVLLSPQLTGFSDIGVKLLELPETSTDLRNKLTDISAHLGQSTAICSFLIGLKYFAEKKQALVLPSDLLTKYKLPEENALRLIQGCESDPQTKELLKNVVFDVATIANDHLLTARSKFQNSKDEIQELVTESNNPVLQGLYNKSKGRFPECFYLPYMSGIPTVLYLERLEKYDFDVLNPKLKFKEWRLAWRSWRNHSNRII